MLLGTLVRHLAVSDRLLLGLDSADTACFSGRAALPQVHARRADPAGSGQHEAGAGGRGGRARPRGPRPAAAARVRVFFFALTLYFGLKLVT